MQKFKIFNFFSFLNFHYFIFLLKQLFFLVAFFFEKKNVLTLSVISTHKIFLGEILTTDKSLHKNCFVCSWSTSYFFQFFVKKVKKTTIFAILKYKIINFSKTKGLFLKPFVGGRVLVPRLYLVKQNFQIFYRNSKFLIFFGNCSNCCFLQLFQTKVL